MPVIQLANSELRFECAADDSMLRAALRAGIGLPYECNVGCCGTCKVELVTGEVEAAWVGAPGLSNRDRERCRVLACQSRPLTDCTIKVRPRDEYKPRYAPVRCRMTLEQVLDITHDIREFRLVADGPARFVPGQYALLSLPGVAGARAYSMCNLPNDEGQWHFQIKRVPGGAATSALFTLAPGAGVGVEGAFGMAYLRTDHVRDIVCIAGGSGLSPVISIARAVVREPALAGVKLHFFYGGRTPRDICGEEMLAELPGFGERIVYHAIISMPELDTSKSWRGPIGFVHELADRTLGDALPAHEIYFAGPPPMAQAVQMMLHHRKVPPARIHFDQFF